jgi:hypothetical protein
MSHVFPSRTSDVSSLKMYTIPSFRSSKRESAVSIVNKLRYSILTQVEFKLRIIDRDRTLMGEIQANSEIDFQTKS